MANKRTTKRTWGNKRKTGGDGNDLFKDATSTESKNKEESIFSFFTYGGKRKTKKNKRRSAKK